MKKLVFAFMLFFSFFASAQVFYALSVPDDFSSVPQKPFPGDTVSLVVNVKNIASSLTVYDVNASLDLNPDIFEPLDAFESLGAIKSNSAKQVAFRFTVKEDAIPGLYRFPVKLSYINGNQVVTDSFDVNMLVNECFRLDVDNLSYSPESVYAGEGIVVSATVKNVCSGSARNTSVELVPVTNTSFDPFLLLSSNVLELGNIAPFESERVSFLLQPIKDAAPQIYVFELKANCLDCKAATSDKVSFEVLAKPDLIFSGVDFSNESRSDATDIFSGENFSFSVQVDNIGKTEAKAVKVFLETDNEIVGTKTDFIGNIDPADSGAAIFDLSAAPSARVGEHTATIVVEYLDENSELQKVSTSYSFFISAPPSNLGGLIFLLVLVIIALGILYFIIKMVFRQLALRNIKLR